MTDETTESRRRWMAVLAKAPLAELEALWEDSPDPEWRFLRAPETALVMVQGRIGGTGQPFNLGEMTITRCSVQAGSRVGHAYIAGRCPRHATLAALIDALMQDPEQRAALQASIIAPLAERRAEAGKQVGRKAAATRVDFFTLVRGED